MIPTLPYGRHARYNRYRSSSIGISQAHNSLLASISVIPQEIIDRILDHLHGDSVSLRSCSFVCRAWLNESRHHLFGLLRIRDSQVCTTLRSKPILTDRFQAFIQFITTTASPGFCSKVHTLCLLGNEERQGSESFLSANILATILVKLPCIRILDINRVHFTSLMSDPIIPSPKIKLDVLSLGRVNLDEHSPDGLLSVLGVFSEIGMLRVSYVETPRQAPSLEDAMHLSELKIRRFSLKGHATMLPQPSRTLPYLLSVLINSPSVHTLQTIELRCCTMDQIHAFGAAIRDGTGPHLTHVAIDIADVVKVSGDIQGVTDALNLAGCTNLQYLRICVFPNEEDAATYLWIRASHYLTTVLSTISATVTSVTVVLQYHDVLLKNCSMTDWEALRMVPWSRFESFEAITFALMPRCYEQSVEDDAKHHISAMLPELHKQGYLQFSTTGFWEDRETIISYCRKGRFI